MLDDTGVPWSERALTLAGATGALVGVALPWLEVTVSPARPTMAGYETIYGILAGVAAAVVLVAAATDRVEQRRTVALLGGAIVVVLATVPLSVLGSGQSAAVGLYVSLLAGGLTVVGGVLDR